MAEHESFEITQGAVVKNSEGAILILETSKGRWILPGGRIDKGETWIEALKRELKEELGMGDFEVKRVLSADSWIENGHGKYAVNFLVEPKNFSEPMLREEHKKYAWVKEENLDDYNFWAEGLKEKIKSFY